MYLLDYSDSEGDVKQNLFILFIYLFITTQLQIVPVLGIMSQTRVFGGNRTHNPHANNLAHYPLDYKRNLTVLKKNFQQKTAV